MKTTLNPYLTFNGDAKPAVQFYHQVLGGDLKVQTFGDIKDMPSPPGYEDKVMHAHLESDGVVIQVRRELDGQHHCSVVGDFSRISRIYTDFFLAQSTIPVRGTSEI